MSENNKWVFSHFIMNGEILPKRADDGRSGPFPILTIRTEEITEDDRRLKGRGWIGAHVRPSVPWPTQIHVAYFKSRELFIFPESDDKLPCVFIRDSGDTGDRGIILRFLSAWSWVEQYGIQVETWTTGSHMFRARGGRAGRVVTKFPLDFDYWPLIDERKVETALAFFREGLSLDHGPYSFLSFFKVLNLVEKGNNGQRALIERYLPRFEDRRAAERLAQLGLSPGGQKQSDYIINSGRHAVAHANLSNAYSVDPDDPEHEFRLNQDLPLIREIAKLVIKHHFNVPTKDDIWRSNTHYISGAIWSIGKSTYERIVHEGCVGRRSIHLPSIVDFRVRGRPQREALQRLYLKVKSVRDGISYATISSLDGNFVIFIQIDFIQGRLVFDPLGQHLCLDDGSYLAAARTAEYCAFWADVVGNGRCQLVESATQYVLAEAEAYLPMNWSLNHDGSNSDIEHWREVAAQRRTDEGS